MNDPLVLPKLDAGIFVRLEKNAGLIDSGTIVKRAERHRAIDAAILVEKEAPISNHGNDVISMLAETTESEST